MASIGGPRLGDSGFDRSVLRYVEVVSPIPFSEDAVGRILGFVQGERAPEEAQTIVWTEREQFRAQVQVIRFMDAIVAASAGSQIVDARIVERVIDAFCPGFWPFC